MKIDTMKIESLATGGYRIEVRNATDSDVIYASDEHVLGIIGKLLDEKPINKISSPAAVSDKPQHGPHENESLTDYVERRIAESNDSDRIDRRFDAIQLQVTMRADDIDNIATRVGALEELYHGVSASHA